MFTPVTILDRNLVRIKELQEFCHWPCIQWIQECWRLNLPFRVDSVFRSQKTQDEKYAQGRTKPGKIVTWTRNSDHTKRIALDVTALFLPDESETPGILPTDTQAQKLGKRTRYAYVKLDSVARKYGISRVDELVKLGDYGHFNCSLARPYQPQMTPEQEKRLAARQIRLLSGNPRDRAIDRYVKRYGEYPNL